MTRVAPLILLILIFGAPGAEAYSPPSLHTEDLKFELLGWEGQCVRIRSNFDAGDLADGSFHSCRFRQISSPNDWFSLEVGKGTPTANVEIVWKCGSDQGRARREFEPSLQNWLRLKEQVAKLSIIRKVDCPIPQVSPELIEQASNLGRIFTSFPN